MQTASAAPAATPQQLTESPIFVPTRADGELWGGIVSPDFKLHHVILLPGKFRFNWNDAMAFAKEMGADLPSPLEQKLLFENLPDEFEKDWYWSNTQNRAYSDYAWAQNFGNGYQHDIHKGDELPVRLVRRVAIR